MTGIFIFISLTIFGAGYYIVWPSRFNVVTHLTVGAVFISSFVPAIILEVYKNYPDSIVTLYVKILVTGAICYLMGILLGFNRKVKRTKLSFDVLSTEDYEKRAIQLTKFLLITGIICLALSYAGMGFVPMFASDPISAKFFRGAYQEPYLRVASLFRASFYILSTIIPISSIIWYNKRIPFFLHATLVAIGLMFLSLSRSPAFTGLVMAIALVLSFKSKFHFKILLGVIVSIYLFSSIFYYLIGVRQFENIDSKSENGYWQVIGESAPDINDQLQFLDMFTKHPKWTYGRTMYGGLIPGHYEWNPTVYTLNVIAPDMNINEIASGGLRLPTPLWGYVSFQWPGVIMFCLISGFLSGFFLKYTKFWLTEHNSMVIKSVVVVLFVSVFITIINFFTLSIFSIPPMLVLLFYMYRFKIS
ncbi:hypothetical protein [uncultured Mucilaginibacter sp.]|uniref:hypothetical protein n=1 Tax=uncultured Mucilaginibacter sp. TaxID=797541 RepID=UPI0025E8FF9F|nr:hypothetical protein [uncultured Mucilaginibacter sp.]